MRSFSRSIPQFIPRQDPRVLLFFLHSKGEGSDLQSHESVFIYKKVRERVGCKSMKNQQSLVELQSNSV